VTGCWLCLVFFVFCPCVPPAALAGDVRQSQCPLLLRQTVSSTHTPSNALSSADVAGWAGRTCALARLPPLPSSPPLLRPTALGVAAAWAFLLLQALQDAFKDVLLKLWFVRGDREGSVRQRVADWRERERERVGGRAAAGFFSSGKKKKKNAPPGCGCGTACRPPAFAAPPPPRSGR